MIGTGHMLRTRLTAPLVVVLALVAACCAAFAAAPVGAAGPAEVLPDLDEAAPAALSVSQSSGIWRLAFSSGVVNVGDGPLHIHGSGPGDETMVADQVVSLDDGSTTTYPDVGPMQY